MSSILTIGTSPGQIVGTATNNNASAGNIGEIISSSVSVGSAVSLTSTVSADVTSISLTAGDWDVVGMVALSPAATTSITIRRASISTTSATLDTAFDRLFLDIHAAIVPAASLYLPVVGPTRLSLSATTTVYLVASVNFTVSTCGAFGGIRARRVR